MFYYLRNSRRNTTALRSSSSIKKLATALNDEDLMKAVTIMRNSEPTNCKYCGKEMEWKDNSKLWCNCCNMEEVKIVDIDMQAERQEKTKRLPVNIISSSSSLPITGRILFILTFNI